MLSGGALTAGAMLTIVLPSAAQTATTVYFDDFNDQQNVNQGGPYTQTLYSSAPTTRSALYGGSSSATWQAGVEAGGWGQRDLNDSNVATPTSSNFLPFTPDASRIYRLEATIDTTPLAGADPGGSSSWFALGFTSSQHNWNGVDASTINVGNLVRWNSNSVNTISYTLSGATLAAAGIKHVGWVTDRAGTVNLSGAIQVKIDNFKLTSFGTNPTVTYNGNGSDGGSVPIDGGSPYAFGNTVTVQSAGSLTRSGYSFSGWNTASDGSGTNYSPSATFAVEDDTTLYAKWIPLGSYTVMYDGNGNTSGAPPVDGSSPYFDGSTVTALGNTGSLAKTSYSFSGWNTAANGSGISYAPSDTFTISGNTTLYARWTVGPNFVWNNSAVTESWNTSDANWTGATWSNSASNNAIFTTGVSNVYLASSIVANTVSVGTSGGNFTNFGLLDGGGSLSASTFTVQGSGSNGGNYGANPTLSVSSAVTVSGDAAIGRSNLAITGGTFSANRIISAASGADWARLVVAGGTVTATNGVDGSVNTSATFAVDLDGGTLVTPSIRVADREVGSGNYAWLTFNGGTVKAIGSDNSNFITTYGGGTTTFVGQGGAIIDTNGRNIGINVNMVRAGASTGGLTKNGTGSLTLGGDVYNYRGNTVVNDGALNVSSSSTLEFKPTTNGTTNSIAGSSTSTLSFLGQVYIDLSTADATAANTWNLVNVASFGTAPVVTPYLVNSSLGVFTEVTSGTWELAVTGAKWVFTESNGNLTYAVNASPYQTWGNAYGLAAGSESGDLDGDGLTNFQEFAYGLVPNNGSSVNPIISQLNPTTGQFSYQRLNGSGLTYSIWTTTDLVNWSEDTGAVQSVSTGSPNDTVQVTLSGAPLTASKLFVRVKAQ